MGNRGDIIKIWVTCLSVCSKVGGGCPVTPIYGKFDRKLVNRGVLG